MFVRHQLSALELALSDTPVVVLHGARQAGKSTLARNWSAASGARYVSLDDATALAAAASDAQGFVGRFTEPAVLDEVQRAPDLVMAIKRAVDLDRRPGRFLLTGSTNVRFLPQLAEALVGRVEILTLWPLSQGEIEGTREGLIDLLFAQEAIPWRGDDEGASRLFERMLVGGYPEVVQRSDPERRARWFETYLTTLLQREVRDLAQIEGLAELPKLLGLLATRTASLLNFTELSCASGLAQTTLKRYLALLEATFLVQRLPAWSSNLGKRWVKSPKVFLVDSGLAAHLLGADASALDRRGTILGGLLETFVLGELMRAATWSRVQPRFYHFRTQTGHEVDFVLEARGGACVGVEVKAAGSVRAGDFRGLKVLREETGEKWRSGIVLYTGSEVVPFERDLYAVPVRALWKTRDEDPIRKA